MMSSMKCDLGCTVAVISMGTMGVALTSILLEHGFRVVTTLEGRSNMTKTRAEAAGVQVCTLIEVVQSANVILSIVPPGGAVSTAEKVAMAAKSHRPWSYSDCVYIDLNAISKSRTMEVYEVIKQTGLTYIDGSILGRPPEKRIDGQWTWFTLLVSGPSLEDLLDVVVAEKLNSVLRVRQVGDSIGAASGLKMCFGAFYKGQAAIMIQAYTAAANLGCLPDLQGLLREYSPSAASMLEASVLDMQHKAYRWITEMEEIAETFEECGGWSRDLYTGVGEVYKVVSENTNLGTEGRHSIPEIISEICQGLEIWKQD